MFADKEVSEDVLDVCRRLLRTKYQNRRIMVFDKDIMDFVEVEYANVNPSDMILGEICRGFDIFGVEYIYWHELHVRDIRVRIYNSGEKVFYDSDGKIIFKIGL